MWFVIDQKSESHVGWNPYNYAACNPIRIMDLDGKDWVDSKGNHIFENGKYTQYATSNLIKLGNALQKTKTGAEQFNKLIEKGKNIEVNINNEVLTNKNENEGYWLGNTKVYETTTTDKKGNKTAKVTKAVITLNSTEVDAVLEKSKTSLETLGGSEFLTNDISYLDVLAMTFGHEIEHTTNDNVTIAVNGGDNEVPAFELSDKILKEIKENHKKESSKDGAYMQTQDNNEELMRRH